MKSDAPATQGDLTRLAADLKDDLTQFATKDDLTQFATKDDLKQFATKDDLKHWGDRITMEVARAASATADEMRRWFSLLLEKHDSDVAAVNANTMQLRTEFDAHRDDADVHVKRAPRRRSRGS